MKTRNQKRWIGLCLSLIHFSTNVAFAASPERSFWDARKKSMEQKAETSFQVASLPAGVRQVLNGSPLGLMQQITAPAPTELPESLRQAVSPSMAKEKENLFRALSPAIGSVRKVTLPANGKTDRTVVVLQDIHLNLEAQHNISTALTQLATQGGADFLALEGAWEDIDARWFREFRDPQAVRLVSDYFLKQNMITGGGHAAMTGPKNLVPVIGMDDATHYANNVDAYRKARIFQQSAAQRIQEFRQVLAAKKEKVFRADLAELDRKVEAYRNERLPLTAYATALSQGGGASPVLRRFQEAHRMESALSFPQVESERTALVEQLAKQSKPEVLNRLAELGLRLRAGEIRHSAFYAGLKKLCRDNGVSIDKAPALEAYVRYLETAESINADDLFYELMAAERRAYDRLTRTAEERALVQESRWALFAAKAVDFSLTIDEWMEFKGLDAQRPLDLDMTAFNRFFEEAEIRDRAMASNVLKHMDEKNARTGVMVAGGFHTPGLVKQLTQAGVAVVTFVPKVNHADLEKGGAYLNIFNQEHTPLNRLFAGEKLFLSIAALSPKVKELAQETTTAVSAAQTGQPIYVSYEGASYMVEKGPDTINVSKNMTVAEKIRNSFVGTLVAAIISIVPNPFSEAVAGPAVTGTTYPHTWHAVTSPSHQFEASLVSQRSNPTGIFITKTTSPGTSEILTPQALPLRSAGDNLVFVDNRFLFVLGTNVAALVDLYTGRIAFLPAATSPVTQVRKEGEIYILSNENEEVLYKLNALGEMVPLPTSVDGSFRTPTAFLTTEDGFYTVFWESQRNNVTMYVQDNNTLSKISVGKKINGTVVLNGHRAVFLSNIGKDLLTFVDLKTGQWEVKPLQLPSFQNLGTRVQSSVTKSNYRSFEISTNTKIKLSYDVQTGAWITEQPFKSNSIDIPREALLSPLGSWFATFGDHGMTLKNAGDGNDIATLGEVNLSQLLSVSENAIAFQNSDDTGVVVFTKENDNWVTYSFGGKFDSARFSGDTPNPVLILTKGTNIFTAYTSKGSEMTAEELHVHPDTIEHLSEEINRILMDIGIGDEEASVQLGKLDARRFAGLLYEGKLYLEILPKINEILNSIHKSDEKQTSDLLDRILTNSNEAYQKAFLEELEHQFGGLSEKTVNVIAVNSQDQVNGALFYVAQVDMINELRARKELPPLLTMVVSTSEEATQELNKWTSEFQKFENAAVLTPGLNDSGLTRSVLAQSMADTLNGWRIEPTSIHLALVNKIHNIASEKSNPRSEFESDVQVMINSSILLPEMPRIVEEILNKALQVFKTVGTQA